MFFVRIFFYFLVILLDERYIIFSCILHLLPLFKLVFPMLVQLEYPLFILHPHPHFLQILRIRIVWLLFFMRINLETKNSVVKNDWSLTCFLGWRRESAVLDRFAWGISWVSRPIKFSFLRDKVTLGLLCCLWKKVLGFLGLRVGFRTFFYFLVKRQKLNMKITLDFSWGRKVSSRYVRNRSTRPND